jgi:hypothetical protein
MTINTQELAKFMSSKENFKFICDSPNETEKKKRIEILKTQFEKQSNFASFAFAAVEDSGNPDNAFFDDEANGYPQYDGVQKVRRIVEDARAKSDAVAYAEARNKAIRAGRERAKKNLSKPFEYNQHGTK